MQFVFRYIPYTQSLQIAQVTPSYALHLPSFKHLMIFWFCSMWQYNKLQPIHNLPPSERAIVVGDVIKLDNVRYLCIRRHDGFPIFIEFTGVR